MSKSLEPRTRTRRDPRRALTRQRLIDAALGIVRMHGSGAATKASICQRAGLHRSGFYSYFDDVEGCLAAAAEQVIAAQRARDTRARAALGGGPGLRRAQVVTLVGDLLGEYASQKDDVELSLRCREEASVIGEALRAERARMVESMSRELWMIAVEAGLRKRDPAQLPILANLVLTMVEDAILQASRNAELDRNVLSTVVGSAIYDGVRGQLAALLAADQQP